MTERPAVTVTVMLTLAPGAGASSAVAGARLIVGSVGRVPHVADVSAVTNAAGDFAAAAEACAEQAAADLEAARNRTIPDILPPPGAPLREATGA